MEPKNKRDSYTSAEGGTLGCILGAVGLPVAVLILFVLANVIFLEPLDGQLGMSLLVFVPFGAIAGAIIGALWVR